MSGYRQPPGAVPGSREQVVREPRLRVLHLGSPEGLYGAERWILALVGHLPADRFESIVGVIVDDPAMDEAELCRESRERGIESVQFRAPGKVNFSAVSQVRRYLRDREIDILHTHGYKTDLVGRLATAGTRCRIVTTPHGWSRDAGLALRCYEWLDRASFAFMDAVAPLSQDLHDELSRWPGVARRLHLIRNGVDLRELDEAATAEPAGVPSRDGRAFVLGYIGQLIYRKGLDTLLEALSRPGLENAELWIVGEGPERAELEQLSAALGLGARVRFFGFRADRIALLRRFDAFVLPSSLEGIPRCLMEAMAVGVPVVASDIPGCNDLVSDGETGMLFPVRDPGALHGALVRLAADAGLRERLAGNARAFVRREFSAERMAESYAELYAALATPGDVSAAPERADAR